MLKKRIDFRGFLSSRKIEKLEDAALDVLSKYGMSISNKKAIEKLSEHSGVKINGNRILLDRDLVKNKIELYKKDKKSIDFWSKIENVEAESQLRQADHINPYPNKPILRPSGHCFYILDPKTGKIRPLLTQDVIDMTKLLDSLSKYNPITISAPGNPTDLPGLLQPVARYKISCEYSRHGGFSSPCNDIRSAKYIYEMSKVIGKPFVPSIGVISPLRMEGNEFDTIMYFIDKKLLFILSTWGMLGATTPISIAKASAQIMAEAFGGFTILKLLSGEGQVNFFMRLIGFNMKEASMNYGTPESILLDIITADLNRHYGNIATCQFNTMAKEVGVQSGVEKISSALFGIINKVSILGDLGSLCLDEVFSPEQAVYDCEILDNAMRLARGFDFEDFDTDSFIDELRQTKTFLESDETIKNFRNVYWMSKLFSRSMLQQYFARKENQRERVREIIKEKIKEHDFELDDDKRKEINRIYRTAERELG